MGRRALVTGIFGQDGAYMAKLLLEKGYTVHGAARRSSSHNSWRLEELGIAQDVRLIEMELLEFSNVLSVVERLAPDEVYNFAAQSAVGTAFRQPLFTAEANGLGVARLLEAIRLVAPGARFYQASTSEMFGKAPPPQCEETRFHPRSPYAVAKLYAHWMTVNYRESYSMHASCGILFNHESPLRGREFVTRKITSGFAEIEHGRRTHIELGNLDARRDWGFAGDCVEGIWAMVQQPEPDDYVLATGECHTVRDFAERAAAAIGRKLEWAGEGCDERGLDGRTGKPLIVINPELYRPAEVDVLKGDSRKARERLGWVPRCSFDQLVQDMVETDMRRMDEGRYLL